MASRITLHRGFPGEGTYVWSPFATKIEFRFRQSKVPYTVDRVGDSPKDGPRGKIPFIDVWFPAGEGRVAGAAGEGGEKGEIERLGDTSLIIKRLVREGVLMDLNAKLDQRGKLADMAMRALCEEKLYFYNGHERWIQNYYVQRDKALASVPWPLRNYVVGPMVYRNNAATLHGQGTGRFSADEIQQMRKEAWGAIESGLESVRSGLEGGRGGRKGGKAKDPFWVLGGNEPTEADATLFGFVISVLIAESNPKSTALLKSFPAVMDYATRIHEQYFEDYPKWM